MVVNLWPQGFEENWSGLDKTVFERGLKLLEGDSVLEIGCGNGRWTSEFLVPRFKTVYAVDVIDKPTYGGFIYHRTQGCNLSMFDDQSVDCVYSNGVFCHLPHDCQRQYLKEIKRVMRKNGFIMLANWQRHNNLSSVTGTDYAQTWYYNDTDLTDQMMNEAGLSWIDFDKSNRDTLAYIWQ
jgi:cyclopropane fatty-acyl-phospholipid synthase-like methyltransferase